VVCVTCAHQVSVSAGARPLLGLPQGTCVPDARVRAKSVRSDRDRQGRTHVQNRRYVIAASNTPSRQKLFLEEHARAFQVRTASAKGVRSQSTQQRKQVCRKQSDAPVDEIGFHVATEVQGNSGSSL